METRGLKSLFAGGLSSILPLVTLEATLYLVAPLLGYDITGSEDFLETMIWAINTGMIAGSIVSVINIHKLSSSYYFILFLTVIGCHSLVYLTTQQNDVLAWLTIGVTMGTFSTICQFKVILRSLVYENKDYKLGLIPLAISGITFGNILGLGIQFFVLTRFPLSNTVNEKMFLIYIWIFTIVVMVCSYKFHSDISVEVEHGGKDLNKDTTLCIVKQYRTFSKGFYSFRLCLNPLFIYLLSCALDSFFIPASVNIITDSFHHIKYTWNRYALLFTYYTAMFCGNTYSILKSKVTYQGIRPLKIEEHVNWPLVWFFLLFLRLPIGILFVVVAHYRSNFGADEEILMVVSIVGTLANGFISGIITSLSLLYMFFSVMQSEKSSELGFHKARVVISFSMYIANYVKFLISWIGRKYLALFGYVLNHSGNGTVWPTATNSSLWKQFTWWVHGTMIFTLFDLKFIYNVFIGIYRELMNYQLEN